MAAKILTEVDVTSSFDSYFVNDNGKVRQINKSDIVLPIDSTLSISGKAADAKITGDAVSELKNETSELKADLSEISSEIGDLYDGSVKPFSLKTDRMEFLKIVGNIFYSLTFTDDIKVSDVGQIVSDTAYTLSEYIPVDSGKTLYIKSANNYGDLVDVFRNSIPRISYYDKYHNFIKTDINDSHTDLAVFTFDANIAYVRILLWKNMKSTPWYFGFEDSDKFITSYHYEFDDSIVTNVFTNIVSDNGNYGGLPRLYFYGDISQMTKDNAVDLQCRLVRKEGTANIVANVKWQGSSSIAYEKKNYTIKLYENSSKEAPYNIEFKNGWGSHNKYCLKANFVDYTHSRNVISAKLWGEIVKSRASKNEYLYDLPNGGAIDGFPIMLFINEKYNGIYTLNIPKDKWLFGMGESDRKEAVIVGESYSDSTTFNSSTRLYDESDWTIEVNNNMTEDEVKVSFNTFADFVMNNDGTVFKEGIGNYLDIDSAIDYFVFASAICGKDSWAKNSIFVTFDGVKWICSAYDLDTTFGNNPYGTAFYSPSLELLNDWKSWHKLWNKIRINYYEEIKSRYRELRESILSDAHIYDVFYNFHNQIPRVLLEKELELYPSIPSTSTHTISAIMEFWKIRSALNDKIV